MICKICGNSMGNKGHLAKELHFGTGEEFAYFQCARCRCLQIADIPADMSRFYPADYYSITLFDEDKFKGIKGYLRDLPVRSFLFPENPLHRLIARLLPHKNFTLVRELGLTPGSRVLDVGCGKGKSFLYPLRRMGFRNVAGCDPFIPEDVHYGNGLSIYRRELAAMEGEGCWDLITFHHSFEHIHNPVETMQAVSRLLRPGGLCLLRIPTSSSFAWEHYGVYWVQLDAPRHLFLHSAGSIRHLAEIAGLSLNKVVYDSNHFQFSGSENYLKGIPLREHVKGKGLGKIGWLCRRAIMNRRARRLNEEGRGDQAAFLLQKVSSASAGQS